MEESDHHHPSDVATGVAFINTRDLSQDTLPTVGRALDWMVEQELMHPEASEAQRRAFARRPETGDAELAVIRAARGAMRELADAVAERRAPAPAAVARANEILAGASAIQVVATPSGIGLTHVHAADPIADALARLVEPLVREIAAGRPDRLRICASDTCRWVFYDTSRPNSRRWCEMASCGNRMKVRRYRARARASTEASPTSS